MNTFFKTFSGQAKSLRFMYDSISTINNEDTSHIIVNTAGNIKTTIFGCLVSLQLTLVVIGLGPFSAKTNATCCNYPLL